MAVKVAHNYNQHLKSEEGRAYKAILDYQVRYYLRRVGGEQGEVGGPEGRSISKLLTVQSWDLNSYTQIKSDSSNGCSS